MFEVVIHFVFFFLNSKMDVQLQIIEQTSFVKIYFALCEF